MCLFKTLSSHHMIIILKTETNVQESLCAERVWQKTDEKSICTSWKLTKKKKILWLFF